MEPFYETIKHNRESLGLSVEQISNRTKISKEIISAIEAGEIRILPKTYMRLFLKAYAQEINLDPQTILRNFEELLGESGTTSIPLQTVTHRAQIAEIPELLENHSVTKSPNRNFATIVIILIIIVFLISVLKQVLMDEKKKRITAAFPVITTSDTTQTAIISPDSQSVVPQNELKLTILTKDSCWIKIIVDGRDSFEAILPPHYKKEAVATEQFDIRVGRPACVNLILNGKDIGPVGAPAIPTRLVITKDGIVRRQSFTTH